MTPTLRRFLWLLTTALLVAPTLYAQGFISGTVRRDGGTPLAGMVVAAYNSAGELATTNISSPNGSYTLSLPAATYRVLAYDPEGNRATSFYSDASSFETSAEITVAPGATRSGIDFRLHLGFRIHGTVRSAATGQPLENMVVSAYNLDGTRRGHQKTGADGAYVLSVPAGQYKMAAWDDSLLMAPEFYSEARSFTSASTISVTASVFNINFTLDRGAKVSGRAVAEETGQPLPGIEVSAYDVDRGDLVSFVTTHSEGEFLFALPPGRYKFGAADPGGAYVAEFYANAPNFGAAASFELGPGDTRSGFDFALAPHTEPPTLTTLFIPAVINAAGGDGSYWRTDVWIYNPSQESLDIEVTYLAGDGSAGQTTITVSPRGQVEIADIVGTRFGTSGLGALQMTAPGPFVAVSRTFNTPPNAAETGTFGFSIAAMERSASMGLAVLPGIAHGSSYRTNVGMMNPHEHPVTVRARLHSAGGALVGDTNVTLAPLTVQQPGIAQLFGDIQLAEGYVALSSTDGSFFSYASVVDRKSNDPTVVLPSADQE